MARPGEDAFVDHSRQMHPEAARLTHTREAGVESGFYVFRSPRGGDRDRQAHGLVHVESAETG